MYILVYKLFRSNSKLIGPGVRKVTGDVDEARANDWIAKGLARLATDAEITAYETQNTVTPPGTGPQGPPGPKGDKGDPGDGNGNGGSLDFSRLIIGEIPIGALNGSNATFAAANDFIPETVQVFINGVASKRSEEFVTSGARGITLSVSPGANEGVLINYVKNGV